MLWLRVLSLTVLVQTLLLLKTVTYEMKTMTDVFCNVDGMDGWCGAPGPKPGTAVSHVHPEVLPEDGIIQLGLHLTPQRYTGLQMLIPSQSVCHEMSVKFSVITAF